MPKLSIIIPTYKRAETLRMCLDHIARQTVREDLEVIIVSDGDDVETEQMLKKGTWSFPLQYFSIPKGQQGVARNVGVSHASGEWILFIGDDIVLFPETCEWHLRAHESYGRKESIVVLGFITWHPKVGVTPVMEWLERSGWQFGYRRLARYRKDFLPRAIQHRFTYASNISLPTEIARRIPFRNNVTLYGWEDREWGRRLSESVRMFYEHRACALHHHHLDRSASLKRMEMIGRSAVEMTRVVPDLAVIPQGWKWWAYHLMAMLPTMRGRHAAAFLHGIQNAQREQVRSQKSAGVH